MKASFDHSRLHLGIDRASIWESNATNRSDHDGNVTQTIPQDRYRDVILSDLIQLDKANLLANRLTIIDGFKENTLVKFCVYRGIVSIIIGNRDFRNGSGSKVYYSRIPQNDA